MDSNEQDEDDGINELPYFYCSDNDVPDFCELKQQSKEESKNLEHQGIDHDEIENYGIDRISDLPDHVLCGILSFLPTKYAMAAKVLSARWGSLFPYFWISHSPLVIDLEEDHTSYVHGKNTRPVPSANKSFEIFTDRLLHETLINYVPCLDVLKLKYSSCVCDNEKMLSWIRAALQLNVRELSINIYTYELEKLFDVLNGYTGLERLEIRGGSDLELPDNFIIPNLRTLVISLDSSTLQFGDGCSFPNLRELLLSEVQIYSGEMEPLNELINSCLALEVLSFKSCNLSFYGNSSFCLSIQCPSLKNFTIEDCIGIWKCALTIDAPKLQELFFKGLAAKSYNIPNSFNSLLSAHIDVEFPYAANGVEELVAACSSAVNLYLSSYVIDALHLTFAQLPVFMNMKRLVLGYIQFAGWAMLARLLCNSPNLEKLTFKQGFCLHDGGYVSFESLITSSPSCLEFHVMEIEFLVFDEKEDEIKLVEYFMNNGKAIETLKLSCLPFKHDSTRGRMSMLPRQSKLIFQPR